MSISYPAVPLQLDPLLSSQQYFHESHAPALVGVFVVILTEELGQLLSLTT